MTPRLQIVCLAIVVGLIGFTCASTKNKIAMEPSTDLTRDVFTAKGLAQDNRWIGVTDVFDPEKDPRVVVVARFAKEDLEKHIVYEVINPENNIVMTEERFRPKNNPLGIYFDMNRLMDLGGEGKWKALIWGDGDPIGRAIFWLGEKKEGEGAGGPGYYVVGEDSLLKAEELEKLKKLDSLEYSNYIQEATPDLQAIPSETLQPESASSVPAATGANTAPADSVPAPAPVPASLSGQSVNGAAPSTTVNP
ncbi:MAG: hypothetical protein GC154_14000 [bacterium]|nr:hypothetical protein [bacterium]